MVGFHLRETLPRYVMELHEEVRGARSLVRGHIGGLCHPPNRRPAGRDRGAALPQRVRLEPGRPRRLHERLRARLAHELRLRRPRDVRLAEVVRPLPDHVLRPRQVARLPGVRGGARAPPRPGSRALHGTLQAGAARFRDGERAVHTHPSEARSALADSARPHVFGSEVTRRASRIPHPGLLLMLALAGCKGSGDGMIALEGATLIDGSGRAPVTDGVILVKDGHIQAVARVNEIPVPRGALRMSLIGKAVIPGLVDSHAHVERWAVERYLAWGVTTVRDLGASSTDSSIALKNDLNLGSVLGPRMFTSGAMIDGVPPTYPAATAVSSRAEVRRAVDQRAAAGADRIKISPKVTADLLPPLLDEASTLRFPVAAHLGKIDALTAARAGVASLEHMAGVVQAASRNPGPYLRAHDQFLRGWALEEAGWALLDSAALEGVAPGPAAAHVAIVPTLGGHGMLSRLDHPTLLSRPGMEDVPSTATSVRDVAGLLRRTRRRAGRPPALPRARGRPRPVPLQ